MPVKIIWSNSAQQSLLNIYVDIGLENPVAAERWYDRLKARAYQLADQPRMGPRRPDLGPTVRAQVERPYLILYETHPDDDESPVTSVEIVAVIDGRRNLDLIQLP